MDLQTILWAALAGAGYGILFYVKKRQQTGEEFDPWKLGATVALAAIIGFAMGVAGMPVTQAELEVQIVAYIGYVVIIENALKIIWRYFNKEVPA